MAAGGGCTAQTATTSVTVNPNPTVTLSTVNTSLCAGGNTAFIATATPTGTYTYDFYLNSNPIPIQSSPSNTITITGLVTGDVVQVIATNTNNCSATSSLIMNMVDTQAPVLIQKPNFTKNSDATNCYYTNIGSGRILDGTANDNCGVASYSYVLSGATTIQTSSLQGLRFNVGVTTITWAATDLNNNTSSPSQFTVTVVDSQAPVIEAPEDITRSTDLYSCVANSANINVGTPTVTDNCLFRVFNDAPAEFPVGETIVTWTALDSAGNTSTDEQLVTITEQLYVNPSDSLILVQLYNEMGGDFWNTSWDLNAPVSTWYGIGVSCGAVSSINLSANNLTGTLPSSVLGLSRRTEPNFFLNIGGNRLGFDSAEDFVGLISNFIYSPQSKIYSSRSETIGQSESISFTSETEGDFNRYQWYKDQTPITGATSPTFNITDATVADAGIYICQVTNTIATALTLERRPITLNVEGFVNPTDSLALVAIFEQTGGTTTWTDPWDLTQLVATWEGVTLSGSKITELDLSSRNLTGNLPEVFDEEFFSELRYLSFFDNNLGGQIPVSIGAITTLTYLDLDKNNFEGSVPASFGNLVNLQALWLSRNYLTSLPDEIGNLRSLQNLYLNDNKFTSLPETIGNLSELLVLNVSDNELTGLPNSITNLRKLVQFYANRNYIVSFPTNVQNFVDLTVFEINTNNLTTLPTGFLQLSSLSKFRVSENELEFDDLLPYSNKDYSVFEYAPQAPINEEADILAVLNSSVSFSVQTQGNGNMYQWFRSGISVASTQTLTINRVSNDDVGIYTAQITNSSLPDLTLQRRSITLNIECQNLNIEIKEPTQTVFCEGQPFGLKLEIDDEFITPQQIRWRKDGVILAFANEKFYTVTTAGTYIAEILTTRGCTVLSNVVAISVLPQPEVRINLENEEVFRSSVNSQEPVTYQWLKDGVIIQDAFESSYTPTQTGEYSLLVLTESGCSSVSETIIFTQTVTGIEEPKELQDLAIFPNPNKGNFFIDFGTRTPNGEPIFVLIDAIGRKLVLKTERISSTRYKVNTTNLTGGMYYLQIETKDGLAFRKFVIEE
jgi:Leucine-rich repeat (LRR) protein